MLEYEVAIQRMNAKDTLVAFQKVIEPLIDKAFQEAEAQARRISPDSLLATQHLKNYTLRKAKRIRGALMYYTYQMMGGKDLKAIMDAAISIEILHAYLLIHDDVMDQDPVRRGEPTMHKIYEDIHRKQYLIQDPAHFGESMAISIGDVGSHFANKKLIDSDFPADRKIKALSKFNEQIMTVGHGQMLDILSSVRTEVEEEDVMRVHLYKTAKYTYETPISIGAILAGASDQDVSILAKYAIPAGIAFQIQDDILGMFGDEDKLGKPNTSDLREGKNTLLIIKALEKSSRSQLKIITQALGNSNLTDQLADQVREIIIETGSLDYSKETAINYVLKAKKALAKMPNWNGEGRAFLDGIADYMINREF